MSLTLVVTRDVEPRYRGFLGSTMLEVSAGVYISPRMSAAVRERVWAVLADWHASLGRGAIVMIWRELNRPGGLGLSVLGEPPKDLREVDGLLLVCRALPQS